MSKSFLQLSRRNVDDSNCNKVKWNMLVKQTWETYMFKLYQNVGHAIAIMSKDVLKHSMKIVNVHH